MKDFLKDYFTFTKKERAGILIIIFLILTGVTFPFIYKLLAPKENLDNSQFKAEAAYLESIKIHPAQKDVLVKNNFKKENDSFSSPPSKFQLFLFDPNTASRHDWIRLGIRDKTAQTIEKYLAKGGHFKVPADISKIYGLHQEDIDRLMPYIKIQTVVYTYKKHEENKYSATGKNADIFTININTIDSLGLLKIPGIGQVFSRRILKFRDRLGGFYSVDQLGETYGLPDSTFQKIKKRFFVEDIPTKRMNLNNVSLEELKSHPYIKYPIANSIVQYRNQHGNFKTLSDLKNIMLIDDGLFEKISHYLTID